MTVEPGHVIFASDGKFLSVDDAFCSIMRSEPARIVGRHVDDLTAPADRMECNVALSRLCKNRKAFKITKRFLRDDGSLFWTTNSVFLTGDENGVVTIIATIEPVVVNHHLPAKLLSAARRQIVSRRDRILVAETGLFSEPGWDTVLAAYVAEAEGRSINADGLAMSLNISQALTLRWIQVLIAHNILEVEYRQPMPDVGKAYRLTGSTQKKLENYLSRHASL